MCGICGKIYLDSRAPVDVAELRAMATAIRHRGPDDEGYHTAPGVGLGMRRLSIVDLEHGGQPVFSEDGRCALVYNGELYNFQDLRAELSARGHRFHTHGDTEVVMRAYEAWGAACLRRFNGMYAFALYDGRDGSLLLARDRIGEKPLYYYRDDSRLVFASEIKAILADPTVPRELDPKGLANFLAFSHAVAPDTMYRRIYKLLPGHYLTVRGGEVRVSEYWDVGHEPVVAPGAVLGEDEYAARIRDLLDDSVRRRMVADVPVGAFLSGGVDSSAIAALMVRHATGPVRTFSLGFRDGGAYNELSDARRVAAYLGTEHHELELAHTDLVGALQTLVYHYDEPFGDAAGFNVYLLSRFTREHVTVALSGDGGDELFGGYRRFAADQLAAVYQRFPRAATHRWIPALAGRLPRLRRIKRTLETLPLEDPARRYARWLSLFTPEMQAGLLEPGLRAALGDHDPAWPYPLYYGRLNGHTDHLNRLMYVDLKTWLPDVYMEKTDKASMASSLEVRVPFLDHRLVELAFQIPARYKVRGWSLKRILKRAVRDLVPAFVLRKPKHGFAVPTDPWFRGALKDFTAEVLLDEGTARRGYFNMAAVERLWREHVEGRHVWDTHLWLLLNFELWHRTYLDEAPVPAGA